MSFTCQPIFVIIATLIIHHSFTLPLQAQTLPFQQILPSLTLLLYPLDCLRDHVIRPDFHADRFIFTGRPAQSAAMPVLFLLSGPKIVFSPRNGDKRINVRSAPPCQISRLSGQKCENTAPKTVKISNFWP